MSVSCSLFYPLALASQGCIKCIKAKPGQERCSHLNTPTLVTSPYQSKYQYKNSGGRNLSLFIPWSDLAVVRCQRYFVKYYLQTAENVPIRLSGPPLLERKEGGVKTWHLNIQLPLNSSSREQLQQRCWSLKRSLPPSLPPNNNNIKTEQVTTVVQSLDSQQCSL